MKSQRGEVIVVALFFVAFSFLAMFTGAKELDKVKAELVKCQANPWQELEDCRANEDRIRDILDEDR